MSIFTQQIERLVEEWKAKRATLGRPVKEWIGKTAADMPPERIRQRILDTWDSVCWLSGIRIDPAKGFDLEHAVEIADGKMEANREAVLRPVLRDPHILKTAREKRARSLAERKKRAANGTKVAPKHEMKSAPMPVRPPQRKASRVEPGSKTAQIRALRERAYIEKGAT